MPGNGVGSVTCTSAKEASSRNAVRLSIDCASSPSLPRIVHAITATPEVIAQFRQQGATAIQSTPDDAARKYDGVIARYRDIVARAKIPPAD